MKEKENPIQFQLGRGLVDARKALDELINHSGSLKTMEIMTKTLAEAFDSGQKAMTCGNGGSACDAMHFAEEFTGRFRKDRPALPVISLLDSSHLSCVANDYGWDEVFARAVSAYGKPGDILIAISTSGNSSNVIRAVEQAEKSGIKVFLFLGKDGGKLKNSGDFRLILPGETTDRIQELHMLVLHLLIEGVERILFPENYA